MSIENKFFDEETDVGELLKDNSEEILNKNEQQDVVTNLNISGASASFSDFFNRLLTSSDVERSLVRIPHTEFSVSLNRVNDMGWAVTLEIFLDEGEYRRFNDLGPNDSLEASLDSHVWEFTESLEDRGLDAEYTEVGEVIIVEASSS